MNNINSTMKSSELRLYESPYQGWYNILICLIICYFIIDVMSYRNVVLFTYAVFLFGLVLLIYNKKFGIIYYVAAFILCTDTPYTVTYNGFSSIHTTPFFLQTTMANWTSCICFMLIITLTIHRREFILCPMDRIILKLGYLFLFSSIVGFSNLYDNIKIYISDASYYINMFTAYFMVRLLFRSPAHFKRLFVVVWASLLVWCIFGLVNFILGIGVSAGYNIRPYMDSSRNIIPFLTLHAFVYYIYQNKIDSKLYIIQMLSGGLALLNILFFASRGNIICTSIGFIVIIYAVRTVPSDLMIRKKPLWKLVTAIIIFSATTIIIMQTLRPGSTDYLIWKIKSTTSVNTQANVKEISSANVRWLSAINIIAYLNEQGNLVWGQGLGGYFKDDYLPFTQFLIGGSAFNDEWITSGKLYKPHGIQLFILLKIGFLGLLIYLGILFAIFREGLKIVKRSQDLFWRCTTIALLAFLPLMFYKNFNSKLQLFFGLVVGMIAVIGEIHKENTLVS